MKKNRFVIIGLGNIGMELINKLSKEIELVCIDKDPETEEPLRKSRPESSIFIGDATSRLVLEQAGTGDADGVIITTANEKVNIEISRILKEHLDSKRVIAIGSTKGGVEALESLGVETVNIFTASAVSIRNKLEQKSRAAHAIGLGKDEILEVEVHPNSRLANRPLRTLTPIHWRIGIIYRDENIVVPKRETVLKPGDRVVILGVPAVLQTVSEILSFNFQQFPLEYGSCMIAYLYGNEPEEFFDELDYLFSVFPLARVVFLCSGRASRNREVLEKHAAKENLKNREFRETALSPFRSIEESISELRGELGMVALWKKNVTDTLLPSFFHLRKKRTFGRLLRTVSRPVLLSCGTYPYKKSVVPCVEYGSLQRLLETGIEISFSLNNELSTLIVNPSKYISSDEEMENFNRMKKMINDVSLMYKSAINRKVLDGNPVRAVTESLKDYDLVISDAGREEKWYAGILNPDINRHIIRNSPVSTLVLPKIGEFL